MVGRLAWTGDARRGARAQAPLVQKPQCDRAGRRRKWGEGNGPCDGAGLVEVWADEQ